MLEKLTADLIARLQEAARLIEEEEDGCGAENFMKACALVGEEAATAMVVMEIRRNAGAHDHFPHPDLDARTAALLREVITMVNHKPAADCFR